MISGSITSSRGSTFTLDVAGDAPRAMETGRTVAAALSQLALDPDLLLVRLNGRLVPDTGVAVPKAGDVVMVDHRVSGA